MSKPEPMQFEQPTATAAAPQEQPQAQTTNTVVINRDLPPEYQFRLRLIDQAGDIAGVIAALVAILAGKLTDEQFVLLVFGVLGVNNGVRHFGSRARDAATNAAAKVPPGLGAVALAIGAAGAWLAHMHSNSRQGFARVRALRDVAIVCVLVLALSSLGCAGNSDGMAQAVNGYSTFHLWAQRVCGVLTTLPSPATVRSYVGSIDAGTDASQ